MMTELALGSVCLIARAHLFLIYMHLALFARCNV